MERVTGIEPVSQTWKAWIIAIIRYPHCTCRGTQTRTGIKSSQRTRANHYTMPRCQSFLKYHFFDLRSIQIFFSFIFNML